MECVPHAEEVVRVEVRVLRHSEDSGSPDELVDVLPLWERHLGLHDGPWLVSTMRLNMVTPPGLRTVH